MRDILLGAAAATLGWFLATVLFLPPERAQPARLIGKCNGTFYAGMEEDHFPAGCAWIKPIRVDVQ